MTSLRERVANVNIELLKMKIEKSGHNKHKGYRYYELHDILPPVMVECYKKRISVEFPFVEGVGILKLVDFDDKKDYIPFRIQIPELIVPEQRKDKKDMRNAILIQDTGANISYLQRYLLKLAFPALNDGDMIDSGLFDTDKASSDNNETTSDRPEQKAEKVSSNINVPELVVEAEKTLKKKGVSDKDIDFKAIKRQVLKSRNFSVSERREIIDYFKKRDKGGS